MLLLWHGIDILKVSNSIGILETLSRNLVTWQFGERAFNNGVGHTAVVIGPSTKSYFTSVDQNWIGANSYTGSPGAKIKHSYNGISGFVRPPYHAETKKPSKPSSTPSKPSNDNAPKTQKNKQNL